ncbi:MAG TPA: hypothetical protein VMW28_02390, partial [Pelolinea sp.]|nr:hypothetical protein [Pelolinea sp.]
MKKLIRLIILFGFLLGSCSPAISNSESEQLTPITSDLTQNSGGKEEEVSNPGFLENYSIFQLPDDLSPIMPENAGEMGLLAELTPSIPPYYVISPDGSRAAAGRLGRIDILDVDTQDVLSTIVAELPDCGYGIGKYFSLNEDGSFIAIVTEDAIQVWQTGGGLIFESPYSRRFSMDGNSCGADLPQLAISPDGKKLAISGIEYSRASVNQFFRVINVIKNETLYKWDGRQDTLHGFLLGFPGLGFSPDGRLIQTFDPLRYIISEGNISDSFRFWSTDGWLEVEPTSARVTASFDPGSLLFGQSRENEIQIIEKTKGRRKSGIPAPGCRWDIPCEIRFSRDGSIAAVLARAEELVQYRQALLYPSVEVWDLDAEKLIAEVSGLFRGLDGILPGDDGVLISSEFIEGAEKNGFHWWTFSDLFEGLQVSGDGRIFFVPTQTRPNTGTDCRYCNTCAINPVNGAQECFAGIKGVDDGSFSIQISDERYTLLGSSGGKDQAIGQLNIEMPENTEDARIRLLNYSADYQTAFYCLDVNFRLENCVIDHFSDNKAIAEFADISYLRIAPDGNTAAFIDTYANALYLYNLGTHKVTRKNPYQARAVRANPVFSSDSSTLFYLVENIQNTGDISVEILDVTSLKTIKRVSLSTSDISIPIGFSGSSNGGLWIIANRDGVVYLISPERGLLLHQWQAHSGEIIGIAIAQDNRLII